MSDIPSRVVKEEPTTPQPSEGTDVVKEETTAQPGDKTPPNQLLEATQLERERRRLAEDRVKFLEQENKALKTSASPENELDEEQFSEEGKIFKQGISEVKSELESIKEDTERQKVFVKYPVLREKEQEFDDYREKPENAGMNLMTAAKAFLAENGMLEPVRTGLEKTTGGEQQVPVQGMTIDEVKSLRENNGKEYRRLLLEKKLKIIPNR